MNNTYISDEEIREVYQEDTVGRKYHTPIVSKNKSWGSVEKPSEPTTLNFNKPMSWKEFNELSDSLKVMYLEYLRDHYHANATAFCQMFNCSRSFWNKHVIVPLNLKGMCSRGQASKMSATELKAWNEFLGKEPVEDNVIKSTMEAPVRHTPRLSNLEFTLEGPFNLEDLNSKLKAFLNEGNEYSIRVTIYPKV